MENKGKKRNRESIQSQQCFECYYCECFTFHSKECIFLMRSLLNLDLCSSCKQKEKKTTSPFPVRKRLSRAEQAFFQKLRNLLFTKSWNRKSTKPGILAVIGPITAQFIASLRQTVLPQCFSRISWLDTEDMFELTHLGLQLKEDFLVPGKIRNTANLDFSRLFSSLPHLKSCSVTVLVAEGSKEDMFPWEAMLQWYEEKKMKSRGSLFHHWIFFLLSERTNRFAYAMTKKGEIRPHDNITFVSPQSKMVVDSSRIIDSFRLRTMYDHSLCQRSSASMSVNIPTAAEIPLLQFPQISTSLSQLRLKPGLSNCPSKQRFCQCLSCRNPQQSKILHHSVDDFGQNCKKKCTCKICLETLETLSWASDYVSYLEIPVRYHFAPSQSDDDCLHVEHLNTWVEREIKMGSL